MFIYDKNNGGLLSDKRSQIKEVHQGYLTHVTKQKLKLFDEWKMDKHALNVCRPALMSLKLTAIDCYYYYENDK